MIVQSTAQSRERAVENIQRQVGLIHPQRSVQQILHDAQQASQSNRRQGQPAQEGAIWRDALASRPSRRGRITGAGSILDKAGKGSLQGV